MDEKAMACCSAAEVELDISGYGLDNEHEQKIKSIIPTFGNVNFAISKSLKLMEGQFGGGFYIKYLLDAASKYGWLNLIIVYPDNDFKSVILYKNYLRETDTDNSGVFIAPPTPKGVYPKNPFTAEGILDNFVTFREYETPTMSIPSRTIWRLIQEHYSEIPIVKISQSGSLEQVYFELAQRAAEYAQKPQQEFMDAENEFYIPAEDFKNIIESNGWHVNQVRTEFDSMGLFVKDKATNSYQKSKHVKGRYLRFYVLKKTLDTVGAEPVSLENTEYQELGYQTKEEKRIQNLEQMNKELLEKYNKLAIKAGVNLEI